MSDIFYLPTSAYGSISIKESVYKLWLERRNDTSNIPFYFFRLGLRNDINRIKKNRAERKKREKKIRKESEYVDKEVHKRMSGKKFDWDEYMEMCKKVRKEMFDKDKCYCSNCGSKISVNDNFCVECGYKLK